MKKLKQFLKEFYDAADQQGKTPEEVEIVRGPNIKPLPTNDAMSDTIDKKVVIKLEDNITTDHIAPAGAKVLPYRSNIEKLSTFVFENNIKHFDEICKSNGGGIIVAGDNYGQGSSREHAAWAIAGYGVRVVISSSFADIHRNNLMNCFVLPVIVSTEFQQELFASIAADPQTIVTVDLPNQTVTNEATGNSEHFDINSYKKYCLMNALDDIDFLLENQDKIEAWEKK